jgi:Apea-like HEPN
MKDDAYLDRIEWEFLQDKVELFPADNKNLPPGDIKITITRGENYELNAKLEGSAPFSDFKKWEHSEVQKPTSGHPAEFFDIECGFYPLNTGIILEHCFLGSLNNIIADPVSFKFDLQLNKIKHDLKMEDQIHCQTEWFIGPSLGWFTFPRCTERINSESHLRCRQGIDDKASEFKTVNALSSSSDCLLISTEKFQCLLSKVHQDYKPDWANKISIEYGGGLGSIPDRTIRKWVQEIISFILGGQFLQIGSSSFDQVANTLKAECTSPWGEVGRQVCKNGSYPPFQLAFGMDVEGILSGIVNSYLRLCANVKLDRALWSYWTAKLLPLTRDIPVLATGLEGLSESWFKSKGSKSKGNYLETSAYNEIVKELIESLDEALSKQENLEERYKQKIINKLRFGNEVSGNGRLLLFFEEIGLPIGKNEKDALNARNKYVHGSNNISDEKMLEALKHKRNYQTLFHRVFLKLLGYTGEYIDRATLGHPNRNIDEPAGGM